MGQCQSSCSSLTNGSQISQDEVQLKPTIEQNQKDSSIAIPKEQIQSKNNKQTILKQSLTSVSPISTASTTASPVNPSAPNQPSSGNQIPSSSNISEKPKASEGSQIKKVIISNKGPYELCEEGVRTSKISQQCISGDQHNQPFRASINIFYGTTSGSSCDFAFQLSKALESEGFFTRVIDLRKFDSKMLFNSTIVVFILSSQGSQGGPTEDAQQFYYWLNNKCKLLPHLTFSVFGLFNSAVQRHPTTQGTNQLDTEQESTHNLDVAGNQTPNRSYNNYPPSPSSYMGRSNNNPNGNYNSPNYDHDPVQAAADFAESAASRLSISMNRKPVKIKSMGQRVDMVLEELQASRYYPLKHFDSAKPDLLKDFFRLYQESLLKKLKDSFPIASISEEQVLNQSLQFNVKLSKNPNLEEIEGACRRESEFKAESQEKQSFHFQNLQCNLIDYFSSALVPINQIQKLSNPLTADLINDNFLSIQIDLSGLSQTSKFDSKLGAEGILEVYVQNDMKSVNKICSIIGVSPDSIISVSQKKPKKQLIMHPSIEGDQESDGRPENEDEGNKLSIPYPMKVSQYITEFLDIHSQVDVNEIFELSKFAESAQDAENLKALCQFQERERFQSTVIPKSQYHSLFSLICSFSIKVPIEVLVGLNRILKPRQYLPRSFSFKEQASFIIKVPSCISQKPNSEARIENGLDLPALGLATSYFLNISENWNPGTQIRIHNSPSRHITQLRSWKDLPGKVILISAEEGIGAICAFLEESNQNKNIQQEIIVFYSSPSLQNGDEKYLFEKDLKNFQEKGILSKLFVQVEPIKPENFKHTGQMQYPIQIFLEKHQEELQQLILSIADQQENKTHICVCGPQLMTQAVLTALAKAQAANSRTSKFAAFNTILNLENDGKILRIAWS